jgi:hypothetical protein
MLAGVFVLTNQSSPSDPNASQSPRYTTAHRPVFEPASNVATSRQPQLETSSQVTQTTDGRENAFRATLDGISIAEIPETLRWLQSLKQDELVRELNLRLVRSWAESDPQATAKWVALLPVGTERAAALDQVAIAWANHEAEAAADWARQLPTADKQNALGSIAQEIVRTDPVKALQFAVELPSSEMRDRVIRHAVAEWATTDADKAIAWVRQIPDKTLREQSLAIAATSWSESNPTAAATLALTDLPTGRIQADTIISIVQRWAQQNSAQAATWVHSFPEGELRQIAIENLKNNIQNHVSG